jgi:NAD(P)H dehydrogenase (quinone)
MKVLTVIANPNSKSFCHAILEQFSKGLNEVSHTTRWSTCMPSV